MATKIKDVQMYFRLSLPREAYSLLDEALKSDTHVVDEIIEKADLAEVKNVDRRWWALPVSLFSIGTNYSEKPFGRKPIWFFDWADKYYPNLTEWQICDETVFGGFANTSIFDGVRCVNIDYC